MRLATYNVENMFERPAAMNLPKWEDGRAFLTDCAELNDLIAQPVYTTAIKDRLLEIMRRNGGLLANGVSKYIRLHAIRKKLVRKPTNKPYEIAIDGRDEWVGWFELVDETVNAKAVSNTARIITLINADILCVVEADDRTALKRFNSSVLKLAGAVQYEHIMLIDGNDQRGIDVGIMTRPGLPIESIASHVEDRDAKGTIFSRDLAEYRVILPGGEKLLVLLNHFKSKGFGSQATSDAKRFRQAKRAREVYDARRAEGWSLVSVLGDFNDTPDSAAMAPLLASGSDLVDVMVHPKFVGDGRLGTHGNGTKSAKLDYLLMSPALAARVTTAGIERRGVWGGVNGTLFPHIPEITKPVEAASDHAALWIDFA